MSSQYGTGFSVWPDITTTMSSVSGIERVAQAIILRLLGTWWYDQTYGYPLASLVLSDTAGLGSLATAIEREIMKDDRVDDASAVAELSPAGDLTIAIDVYLDDGSDFSLVGRKLADIDTDDLIFDLVEVNEAQQ